MSNMPKSDICVIIAYTRILEVYQGQNVKKNQDAIDMTAGLNSPLTKSLIHVLAGGRLGLSLYVFLHNASAGPKGHSGTLKCPK